MKAWVLRGNGGLHLNDVPAPVPKAGEVLVKVMAAGICSSDIPRIYDNGAYHYPIILGHEFAGITSDGRRVGVFPLIPCHKCGPCQSGHYETCASYSYIGSRQDGAYAEYVAVPEWNLINLPDGLPLEHAALLEPAAVALHACKSVNNPNVLNAAVIGNGAIGHLTASWLKYRSVRHVDVLGRNDVSLFNEYDVCIEAVGTSDAFKRCIELVKPNGEVILVGNPDAAFNIGQKLYWQILRKQIAVKGIWNSRYPSDWEETLKCMDKIHIEKHISHKYEFKHLDKAVELMHKGQVKHMKVTVLYP
jgi:L-iditol 2-dehydrogenase